MMRDSRRDDSGWIRLEGGLPKSMQFKSELIIRSYSANVGAVDIVTSCEPNLWMTFYSDLFTFCAFACRTLSDLGNTISAQHLIAHLGNCAVDKSSDSFEQLVCKWALIHHPRLTAELNKWQSGNVFTKDAIKKIKSKVASRLNSSHQALDLRISLSEEWRMTSPCFQMTLHQSQIGDVSMEDSAKGFNRFNRAFREYNDRKEAAVWLLLLYYAAKYREMNNIALQFLDLCMQLSLVAVKGAFVANPLEKVIYALVSDQWDYIKEGVIESEENIRRRQNT